MWRCPKCGYENDETHLCKMCRWDDSYNLERYLLPYPLLKKEKGSYGKSKQKDSFERNQKEKEKGIEEFINCLEQIEEQKKRQEKKTSSLVNENKKENSEKKESISLGKLIFCGLAGLLFLGLAGISLLMGILLLFETDVPGKIFGLCWILGAVICFLCTKKLFRVARKRKKK